MKIIFAATPVAGHINPLLGQAKLLVEDGHEVVIYTGSTLRERVEATGAQIEVLPPEVDFDMRDVDRCFPARRHLDPIALALYDFGEVFIGSMPAQYRALCALLERFPADCIITEQCFFGIVPLLIRAPHERPVVIGCGISFLSIDRDDGLPHGLGLPYVADLAEAEEQRATFLPLARTMLDPMQAIYDKMLRSMDLAPMGSPMSVIATQSDAFLQAGVPELDYPHADLPAHVRFVGAWPAGPSSVALPSWAHELDGTRSVVLVTQGTVANDDLGYLVLPTIRALAHREDLLVIATAGGGDIIELAAQLPANAKAASYLPLDWLMPKVDVLVTNGGFGTVTQALAAGVPIVVAGTTEDKPEIAARLQWSGAGIDLKTNAPTEDMLHEAVSDMLAAPAYRDRARQISVTFDTFDCAGILWETLERLVPAPALRPQAALVASE